MPQIINGRKIYDPSSIEDMKECDEIAKKQLSAFEEREKQLNVKVTVDNDLIKKTMNENDDLKAQNEQVKEIKAFFDSEKQKASDKLTRLGIETDSNSIRTKDDLIRANKTIE